MKKILLIGLAISLSFGSFAQEKSAPKRTTKTINSLVKVEPTEESSTQRPDVSDFKAKGINEIPRVEIGKSANVYSVLLEEQRGMDYNDLGITSFTFRADPATYSTALNSGSIITVTSADGGTTWADHWMVLTETELNRYPSAVIYNPNGNTDASQAYALAAGPSHRGDGFDQNFFASMRLDDQNNHVEYIDKDDAYSGSQLTRFGLQACNNDFAHIVGPKYEDNGSNYATALVLNTMNGEFDGTQYAWEESDIDVELALRSTDGTTKNFWTFGSAWANDGSVGYAWMVGQLEDMIDDGGYQPIVFRSTDNGENWDAVEVMLSGNAVMAEYLIGTQKGEGPVWPLCDEVAGSVDKNGNLQMFVKATSTYSSHPDSIGYTYEGDLNYIFNLELNEDGVQNVMFVDSVMAGSVADDSEYAYAGKVGWGNRLSASKTADENIVFAVWTDTPNAVDFGDENARPDIKAAGRYVDGDFNDFPVTNFTEDDVYSGFFFFTYVAQNCKVEDGHIVIPTTTTVSPGEFGSNGELDVVTHYYIDGIKFATTVGLEDELLAENGVKVSQNAPNPFSGTTTIMISTETPADVKMEVRNMLGQVVYTSNEGRINNTLEVNLDAKQFTSGVYYYTITVGNNKTTKKMIVE
ncbi:MAG: hypothetical protein B7C24_03845 [Bacteroidetes bacterium 4572_77]|nr:MAG: hypothetical protein B7C24_03845 [Bacteroidetes bacterium 4572_77]